MNWMVKTLSFMLILQLSACGGGGGGSDSAEVPDTPTPPPTTPTTPTDPPPTTGTGVTADLVADQEFVFKSNWELTIDFDIPTVDDGFLSICTEYVNSGGEYDVNLDSCPIRTPVTAGVFDGSMNLSNQVNDLVAVLYFYDETATPLHQEFSITNGQPSIVWN